VKANLEGCEALIAILSPAAHRRAWPNIELGAAWLRGINVIPFCNSGIHAGELGRLFDDFHGVNIDNNDPGRDLLGGVADALKLKHPRKLDFAAFKAEVSAAATGIKYAAAAPPASVTPAAPASELPDAQIRILQFLARAANAGEEEVPADDVARGADVKPASFKHHADVLHDRNFVYATWDLRGQLARLAADGAGWLEAKDLMPE
jgi:hypothetical protein